MSKTVLTTFIPSSFSATKTEPMMASHNKKLAHLMRELQPHLRNAAQDLLQPRPKAVADLLNKILKPDQSQ